MIERIFGRRRFERGFRARGILLVLAPAIVSPRVEAQRASSVQDVNRDGLADLLLDFGLARNLGAAGVLDRNSIEIQVSGPAGASWAVGKDALKIVGQ